MEKINLENCIQVQPCCLPDIRLDYNSVKTANRRLARRGGVKKMSGLIYEETKLTTRMGMKPESMTSVKQSGTATVLQTLGPLCRMYLFMIDLIKLIRNS